MMQLLNYLKQNYPMTRAASTELLRELGLEPRTDLRSLTPGQRQRLDVTLAQNSPRLSNRVPEKELLRSIARLISLKHYRGYRFAFRLPVNGQRTSSNRKSARRTLGALMGKLERFRR